MIGTGLNEREKECLLIFFLTNGERIINSQGHCEWKFYKKDYVFDDREKELVDLISRAQIHLLMTTLIEEGKL